MPRPSVFPRPWCPGRDGEDPPEDPKPTTPHRCQLLLPHHLLLRLPSMASRAAIAAALLFSARLALAPQSDGRGCLYQQDQDPARKQSQCSVQRRKEMDGSKYRSKGYTMINTGKKLPYVLLLLLAFAATALSVVVLHKVWERRAFVGLLQERDRQLVSLRIQLHKEKAFNKEMKRKVEEMKATTSSLSTQKTDQKTKLRGLETTITNLKKTQKELEAALMEKDSRINLMDEAATNLKKAKKELEAALTEKNSRIKQMEERATNDIKTQRELEATLREKDGRIKQLEEKATNVNNIKKELETVIREKDSHISQMEAKAKGSNPDQMAALMEILQRKEAELEEIKTKFLGFEMTKKAGKSTPVKMNNASATPDIMLAKTLTNSSSAIPIKSEEKRSANTHIVESRNPKDRLLEEKKSANTTVLGSGLPKDRSLEEKRSANTTVLGSNLPKDRPLEEKRPANTTVLASSLPKDRSLEEKGPANTTVLVSSFPKDRLLEEKRPVNTTVVQNPHPRKEEKRPANTIAVESPHPKDKSLEEKRSVSATVAENSPPKDRSLEEKQKIVLATNKENDGVQGNIDDFDEYLDDIYGGSRSKKSGSPRKNKKSVTKNQVDSLGDELDDFEQLWNSLDQDSDRVRYNRLLEKEHANAAAHIKKKNNADGNLEKISKDSLSDTTMAHQKRLWNGWLVLLM
ncbi:hypothetical protein PR202_gb28664 [Eleusine coracana subsp. coracana]|uniref:Uncharacterized protein n=1 Tax=Eleusine coracana subsp. coracana TaxID=191504 RepID=A0AAV5FV24_ELECO|nr:hypothetical protein PR202_gb28664 [Eleusine coracana subsp. coracana]